MAKYKLIIACVIALFLGVACGNAVNIEGHNDVDTTTNSMFIELERTKYWRVVYHRETKVMYSVSDYSYGSGVFTVLVNPDGSPMTYGG